MSRCPPELPSSPAPTSRPPPHCCDGVVRRTPLWHSRGLADRVGGPVWLKCENLQRTGSFKIRGAYTRISRLTDEERAARRGGGQRRQPRAGRRAGGPAARLRGDGLHAGDRAAAQGRRDPGLRRGGPARGRVARPRRWWPPREYAEQTGAVFIHPFDHPDVIAGQGTVGLEILEQCPEVATVVVSAGGGGLLGGRRGRGEGPPSRRPGRRRAGRGRPRRSPPRWPPGRPVPLDAMSTMADGIAVGRARRAHPRALRRTGRRGAHGQRGRPLPGAAVLPGAGQARGRAGRGGRRRRRARRPGGVPAPGGRGRLRRQHRPGAAAEGGPARHGRRRALPVAAAPGARPAGFARRACWPSWRRSAPTCWRSSTSGPTPGCTSARSRSFVVLETRGPDHADEVVVGADPGGVRGPARLRPSPAADEFGRQPASDSA